MQPGAHFGQMNGAAPVDAHMQRQRLLATLNESTWQKIGILASNFWLVQLIDWIWRPGSLNELLGDHEGALFAYEQALRHNQWSTGTLNAISCILRTKEKYPEAMEYLKNILKVEPANGEAWGNLGKTPEQPVVMWTDMSLAQVTATSWWTIFRRLIRRTNKLSTTCPSRT
jgi:tetratricopeptide (TPR) repeat protein